LTLESWEMNTVSITW